MKRRMITRIKFAIAVGIFENFQTWSQVWYKFIDSKSPQTQIMGK